VGGRLGCRLQRPCQKPLHLRITSPSRGAGRASSSKPSSRRAANRRRQRPTVCPVAPSSAATAWLLLPVAQASTNRARRATT
jgi:hypothetical protein